MKKSKLLFVIPWLPYPMLSGGHQALYNGIAAIVNDYELSLAFQVIDPKNYPQAEKAFQEKFPNIKLFPLVYKNSISPPRLFSIAKMYIKKIVSLFNFDKAKSGESGLIENWRTSVTPIDPQWVKHLTDLCKFQDFDLIQVEMPWRMSDVFALPINVKKIFVHHELGFVCRSLQLEKIEDGVEYASAVNKFANLNEIGQLNLYDGVITLSKIDEQKLRDAGVCKPIFSSFAIVDAEMSFSPDRGDGKRLSFIGPDSHTPNLVGIKWFLDNCWGELKAHCPDITLDIIGKWSEANISCLKAKYPGVNFLGFVDDLYSSISGSTMIVPITVGSGIRMKILEAASKCVPFVSTSVGAEGLPVSSGKDCFIADDASAFVSAIFKLQETAIRNEFVENAYEMVRSHYSIEALRQNRIEIYSNFLS